PRGVRGLKPVLQFAKRALRMSHPTRGAWIETKIESPEISEQRRRTPRGVRGLKRFVAVVVFEAEESHPTRGAWIETLPDGVSNTCRPCRTPRGVRGLKPVWRARPSCPGSRTPRGVRGLKLDGGNVNTRIQKSHPTRGAWIETFGDVPG